MFERIESLTRLIASRTAECSAIKTKIESEKRHATAEEIAQLGTFITDIENYGAQLALEKRQSAANEALSLTANSQIVRPILSIDELQAKYPGLPAKEDRFGSLGEYLHSVKRASEGYMDRKLRQTGMSEGAPTDGGFFVQTDHSTELLKRVYEGSPVVSRVRRIGIGPNANGLTMNGFAEASRVSSVLGGIVMYWLGEAATKTPTHPEFRQIEMKLKKIAGLFYMTDDLLQDAVGLSNVAEAGFAEALDVELERVFLRGTGAGQPLGILNSAALITVLKETGQLANTIVAENIINMWARLWSRSMPNAVWLSSQSILPQLMTLGITIGTAGFPLWTPPQGLAASPYGQLLGRPLFAIENCSSLGTIGDIMLVDLGQYLVIDKGGVQQASSIHVRFLNDETAYRIVYRIDGQPLWNVALIPKDNSATVSPFVTLETRS